MPTIAAITIPANGVDSVCTAKGYAGAPGDNAAKLAFVRQYIINDLKQIHFTTKGKEDRDAVPPPTPIVVT